MPHERYSDIDRNEHLQNTIYRSKKDLKNQQNRPKPFQVHDNERYYNHVFALKPQNQRSFQRNIYSNDYFQPDSLERAEL